MSTKLSGLSNPQPAPTMLTGAPAQRRTSSLNSLPKSGLCQPARRHGEPAAKIHLIPAQEILAPRFFIYVRKRMNHDVSAIAIFVDGGPPGKTWQIAVDESLLVLHKMAACLSAGVSQAIGKARRLRIQEQARCLDGASSQNYVPAADTVFLVGVPVNEDKPRGPSTTIEHHFAHDRVCKQGHPAGRLRMGSKELRRK